jgi:hypothetical protein
MFTSFEHFEGVLSDWTPDIVIAHWHGERYFGWRDQENEVSLLIKKLRNRRGGDYSGKSPFLVGEYWGNDEKFMGDHGRKRISEMLSGLYDMFFDALFMDIEVVPWNVAIGIWNILRSIQGSRSADVPFDLMFDGHLAGRPVKEKERVGLDDWDSHYKKLRQQQEARHEERVAWLVKRTKSREPEAQQGAQRDAEDRAR